MSKVRVKIPGSSGALGVEVLENGVSIIDPASALDFTGAVNITNNGGNEAGIDILPNFTEDNSGSQNTSSITAKGSATNINAAITPKGNGANTAQIPDGTTAGGDARGNFSTDFQKQRTNADEVASGNNSGILAGRNNRAAAGTSGIVSGNSNVVSSGESGFIGSGFQNTSSSSRGAVLNGRGNVASATESSVVGGRDNIATGERSCITNGLFNQSINDYSIAGGFQSISDTNRHQVYGWEGFNICQNFTFGGFSGFTVFDSGGSFDVSSISINGLDSSVLVSLKLILRNRSNSTFLGSHTVNSFEYNITVKRVSGVISIVGTPTLISNHSDFSVVGTTLSFSTLGQNLIVTANIPPGVGSEALINATFEFDGIEHRI